MPPASHTVRAGWHFGSATSRATIGRFHLTEARFPPHLRTPKHEHETPAFCLVLDGRYTQRYGHREVEYRATAVRFRPPSVEHTDRISEQGAACFIIEPDAAWLGDAGLARLASSAVVLGDAGPRAAWLAAQALAEYRCGDAASPLAIEGLVLALAAQFARLPEPAPRRSIPPWLARTRAVLDAQYAARPTLAQLAAEAQVHPVHVSAAFRKAFGISIGDYVRSRRLDAARQALRDPRRSINEIALSLGFSSQSHFTRVFRAQTGLTPLAFRRLASGA